jgi:hypothetical protein
MQAMLSSLNEVCDVLTKLNGLLPGKDKSKHGGMAWPILDRQAYRPN